MAADYPWRDPEKLHRLYHEEMMSTTEIAEDLGCNCSTVWKWMERYDIDRRPKEGDLSLKTRFWKTLRGPIQTSVGNGKAIAKPRAMAK